MGRDIPGILYEKQTDQNKRSAIEVYLLMLQSFQVLSDRFNSLSVVH